MSRSHFERLTYRHVQCSRVAWKTFSPIPVMRENDRKDHHDVRFTTTTPKQTREEIAKEKKTHSGPTHNEHHREEKAFIISWHLKTYSITYFDGNEAEMR